MDPFSQGLLGGALSGAFSRKKKLKLAIFCGVVGGLSPDLDIFIKSINDPLLFIQYHRHFTHSLFFVPIIGLILSFLLFPLLKKNLSFTEIITFTTLGVLTHGILDSFTSYGTSLFWPLSDKRIALSLISIIDPIYTLILLILLIISFLKTSPNYLRLSILFTTLYLFLGYIKYVKVKHYIIKISENREHVIERLFLNPTIGNNILWRSIYKYNKNFYVDAIRMPLFSGPIFFEGTKTKAINKNTIFSELDPRSIQRNDIKRFSFFSMDYIYIHPLNNKIIADLRYGTLPNDLKSLWGIEINVKKENEHVKFRNLRNFEKKDYKNFWLMLSGKNN